MLGMGSEHSKGDDPIGDLISQFNQMSEGKTSQMGVPGLYQRRDGNWVYGGEKIRKDIYNLMHDLAEENHLPLKLILDVVKRESSFRPGAVNKSGARGLVQFMPDTFYEMAYKYGPSIPEISRHNFRDLVTRTKIKERYIYDPASPKAQAELEKLALNPEVNLRLGVQYKLEIAATLEQKLHFLRPQGSSYYPLKPHEFYLALYAGPFAAEQIIRDAYTQRDVGAAQHFSKVARNNKTNKKVLYSAEDGSAYGPKELLDKIAQDMGYDPARKGDDMPLLPDLRSRIYKSEPAPQAIEDILSRQ